MFQLRKETDYALQMLRVLSNKKSISLNDIAGRAKLPFLFLQKIARKLRLGRLIKSTHGAEGGYYLVRPPDRISLRKIIEVMEGGCGILPCNSGNNDCCGRAEGCPLKIKMNKTNRSICKVLDKVKLKDL